MMAQVKSKDSKAELALRRELHRRGLRYRLHASDLPGKPDIAVRKLKLAVFVDGDYWHGNAWRLRGLASLGDMFPNRREWWVAKIEATMARDQQQTLELEGQGWFVIRLWESEILASPQSAADRVMDAVEERR